MSDALAITLANRRTELERLARLVEAFGDAHRLSPDMMFEINLVLDELITNVILHGYDRDAEEKILVRLELHGPALPVTIEDGGQPFDPLSVPPPDLDLPPEDRPVGGLGMHIVRSLVDTLEYTRAGDRNVLTLKKAARRTE